MATFHREPVYLRSHADRVAAAQDRTRIAIEAGTVEPHPNNPRALPGDPARLRGIPMLARGIGGAVNGSRPGVIR